MPEAESSSKSPPAYAKELSWLSFNARVLQEASDPKVPVIQRLRYLGIFSNNLDEFFRVRVADVRRLAAFSSPQKKEPYNELLSNIQANVIRLQKRFEKTYEEILLALRKRKIYLVNEQQLDRNQASFVESYFYNHVQPELTPILLQDDLALPELTDASIYLAIKLKKDQKVRYALLEIPTYSLSRFIQIPQRKGRKGGKVFIVLENIIRHCLGQVFRGSVPFDKAEAYTIKLTRDAELELGEGITQSLLDKVSSSLKRRRKADPVRFVYDAEMPKDLLEHLTKRLSLGRYDSLTPGGRYHNSKDFMNFPSIGPAYLEYKPLSEVLIPELETDDNIFRRIREKDYLLYYPYHSFDHVVDFIKTAAIDPRVRNIKISLYRVARHSHIVSSLINAVRNGKEVTAVVELQARFDEQANIDWARQLMDNGVNIIFGVPGLKVHSKLILIERVEKSTVRYYSHIGTGNFNEGTAKVYTDFSLLTYHQEIGAEVAQAFDFAKYTYRRHKYQHLLMSPIYTRDSIESLIKKEIQTAKQGKTAAITFKCNNLVDERIVSLLYAASNAGVKIKLIIRGMCAIRPDDHSNIRIISIVDRFLEHARVYVFHNGGKPKYYISSADLMTRNLDYRIEVSCPIYDKTAQRTIQDILDIQWHDNVKARYIDNKQSNRFVTRKGNLPAIQSQEVIHNYLKTGKKPRLKNKSRPKQRKRK